MSIFLGSNKGETITPDSVSSSVTVVGQPKKPSAAADIIFAGGGDDIVAGGGGNDIVSLGSGNDTFIWNGGDGNDIVSGDGGYDTLQFNGAALDEEIEIGSLLGATTIKGSVNIGGQKLSSTLLLNSMERITLDSGAGNDTIDASKLGAGRAQLEIFAGDGNDKIIGSAGSDLIVGGRGNDFARMGAGDDTFVWNPGEGSDTVEGDAGHDNMLFNGANVAENVDISANGERTRFFRDVANITMDLNDVEQTTFNALGGADTVTVHALTGFDVREVEISLAGQIGGTAGDGAVDTIVVEGGEDSTIMSIGGALDLFSIDSGSAYVGVVGAETQDRILVKGLGGDDMIIAHPFTTGGINLTIDGGAGDDFIQGANGVETVYGGDGDDFVDGNQGNDIAFLGAGDDIFQWDPGDGSDVVEGGEGFDEMFFNGNGAGENIDIRANGERITFFRNLGNITMDLNDVEQSTFNALGGKDTIVVHALDPFEVHTVKIDLAGEFLGNTGDGAEDTIVVEDNDQFDLQTLSGTLAQFTVSAGNTIVDVSHAEAQDHLVVKGGNGDDSLDASLLVTGGLDLTLDGGAGNDFIQGANGVETVLGGDGDDVVDGNRGDDIAFLGAGDDVFVWDPGDGSDVVEGGEGIDILNFNGAGANEIVDISAVGNRVQFLRNVANIDMDLNSVEAIRFTALGGTDDITVHDLSGTDVQEVSIDLAGPLGDGSPDGQLDTVTLEATSDQDFIDVFGTAESIAVLGAGPAFVSIDRFDATDRLTIRGGAGDDQISASTQAASMQLTLDGGAGDDTIFGSAGAETLIGGDGDDFIDGNRGDDIAILGAGDDIFVWDPGDGSDVVEGGAGNDFMGFRGANAAENVDISANGERVRFFRDVASITMDLNDVESTTFNAFGGVDNINIGDLTGTDLTRIELSLIGGSGTANDGLQDSITIAGSAASDAVSVSTANLRTQIDGLHAQVQITGADAGLDRLQIDTGTGDDGVDASGLKANLFQFEVSLGDGNDAFIGSSGKDVVAGGDGFDVLSGEDGDDVLDGGAGIDILTGGIGDDLFVNGEIIQDFLAGAGSDDRIDLRALGVDFDWVMDRATDTDAGVLFDFDGEQMLLGGVNAASLHQDDFLLA